MALKKVDTVTLTGFGRFQVSKHKARSGLNPKTGEPIKIAAKRIPKFTIGKTLSAAIH